MLKGETKIFLFLGIAILLFWVVSTVINTFLHYNEPLLYIVIFSIFFTISGIFMAKAYGRQKHTEDLLKDEINLRGRVEESLRETVKRAEDEKAKTEAILAAIGDGLSIQGIDFKVLYQNQIHKDEVRTTERGGRRYEIVSSPLRDPTGRIIAGIELVRDITEHTRAEQALEESEKRYRLLFENAPDSIFILEAEGEDAGRIVAANQKAVSMHNFALEELYSMKITDLDTPHSAQEAPAMMRRILAGEWVKEEISHRRKDGSVFPVEVSAGLLEMGGHRYVLAFDRDITARLAAQEAREKLIQDLRDALEKIKTLRGLLPICASCKKIRDDKGYWNQIETYLQSHTEADFSHGICPECAAKLYPDFVKKKT